MTKKGKRTMWILIGIAVFLLVQWLFIGYRFNFGPFKALGDIRMAKLPGNAEAYSMKEVEPMTNSPLSGKNVLFLGSSVTYGSASLREGIPEYFVARLGCSVTKEAVSGTTLTDDSRKSYVSRLKSNVDTKTEYALVIIQLSTNDASKGKPLGAISGSTQLAELDPHTVTGAIEYICAYVRDTWGCPVVFYTGSRYDSDTYGAMVERLLELADKWNITVLDLWNDDGFNAVSAEEKALLMYDNIHPTKAGYRDWWCPELERQLMEGLYR